MFNVYFKGFTHRLHLSCPVYSGPDPAKPPMHMLGECICLRYICVQLNSLMLHAQNKACAQIFLLQMNDLIFLAENIGILHTNESNQICNTLITTSKITAQI